MTTVPLRVMVHEAWDEVRLDAPPTARVADVKRQALARARVTDAADRFLVKHRGAEVPENGTTLAEAGIDANAALIILRRRRVPVR